MQGPSHLMLSWYLAEACDVKAARDRRIVAWAGFAPDVDVAAYVAAIVYYGFDKDRAYENVWSVIHHRYTHGLLFVLLAGVAARLLAAGDSAHRWRIAALAMTATAVHCFLDLAAGGPTWPIYPFWPLSDRGWHAAWSWTVGEWPNLVVLFACLAGMMVYGRVAGRSPLECFGDRADRWLVTVLRQGSSAPVQPRGALGTRLAIWALVVALVVAVLYPLGFNPFG